MSTVMHGRRKGASKSAQKIPMNVNQAQIQVPGMLPNGTDLRQVTVLGKGDWERIQFQLNKRQIEKERMQRAREEREKLHEKSKAAVNNWTNTIQGQRQAKLEARKIREHKIEEERKVTDIEEARYQAQQRKEAIEKAKTQQYYQTDRVKGFHSALLLSEVLKEREAQVELKRLKEQAAAGQDNEYLEQARRDYEESILRDQEQARKRICETKETASFQKAQIGEHLKVDRNQQGEDRIEGEELKRLAAQYELEKMRLADIRNAESKQMMADNLRQIADVKRMQQIQQQQEEEEDDECRVFAAAKRKMMKLRAEKEKDIHLEKQERLEKIREKLSGQMQQKIDDEDDRINNAKKEAEEKREREEAEKAAKSRQMYESMAKNRFEQMREKEQKALEEKKKQLEMLMVKREADAIFRENEEVKHRKKFEENKALQEIHLLQGKDRAEKERLAMQEAMAQDEKNQALVEVEERQFQEYAKKVIDHADKRGRNTYPLHKAAREGAGGGLGPVFPGKGGVRPSYMVSDQSGVQLPNYQRDTTEDTKQTIYGDGRTDKRLGFVW